MDSMGIESLRFESKLKFVNEQAVNQVYLAFSVPTKTLLRPSEKSKKGKKIKQNTKLSSSVSMHVASTDYFFFNW